jgi:MFS transporter, DHA1 family, multidrug resistance protein
MKDIIRDSTIGQIINRVSGGRYLPYSDQRSDYSIPSHFILPSSTTEVKLNPIDDNQGIPSPESITHGPKPPRSSGGLLTRLNTPTAEESHHDHENGKVKEKPLSFDSYLVGWNGDDDLENPRCVHSVVYQQLSLTSLWLLSNWSFTKRSFTTFCIFFLTFSVYIGSAIYTPAIPGLMEEYEISLTKATLGLTLYILGEHPMK